MKKCGKYCKNYIKTVLILLIVFVCICSVSCVNEDLGGNNTGASVTPRPTNVPLATLDPEIEKSKSGGTLKIGVSRTDNMNPLYTENREVSYALMLVYDTFVKINGNGEPEQGVALSWESAGNVKYTFTVRTDLKWHDGSVLTVDEIVKEIDEIKKNGGIYADSFKNVSEFYAEGEDKIVFILSSADISFPKQLYFPIVKESSDEAKTLVGTGPFKYASEEKDSVTYEKNSEYWGTVSQYDGIKLCFFDSDREKYSSDCDVLFLKGKTTSAYAMRPNYTTFKFEARQYLCLIPNLRDRYSEYDYYTGERLYNDINVAANENGRKALSFCIDREKLINTVLSGNGKAADWPVYGGYLPIFGSGSKYTKNMEKATEYFYKAGLYYNEAEKKWYLDAEMTHPCKINLLVLQEDSEIYAAANCLKEDFEAAGLEVMIYPCDIDYIASQLELQSYTFFLAGFETGTDLQMKEIFTKNGEYNYNGFEESGLEALFRGLAIAESETQQKSIDENIESILDATLPIIGLYSQTDAIMVSDRVKGAENGKYGVFNPLYSVCECWSQEK